MLEHAFPTNTLPRNYIWTLGFIGTWPGAEAAEVATQVKSYSRAWLLDREEALKKRKAELELQQAELRRLQLSAEAEKRRLTEETMKDADAVKQRIEAGPLQMAKSVISAAGQLVSGGVTDPTERMAICDKCPFKGDDQRCGKCGCFLPAKTRVAKSSCPIGRW